MTAKLQITASEITSRAPCVHLKAKRYLNQPNDSVAWRFLPRRRGPMVASYRLCNAILKQMNSSKSNCGFRVLLM